MVERKSYIKQPTYTFPSSNVIPFALCELLAQNNPGIIVGGTDSLNKKGVIIPAELQETFDGVLRHPSVHILCAAYDPNLGNPHIPTPELQDLFGRIRQSRFSKKRLAVGNHFINHWDEGVRRQARGFIELANRLDQRLGNQSEINAQVQAVLEHALEEIRNSNR